MGGRSEMRWGKEMYRENYIFNRYIASIILCTNYKLKTVISNTAQIGFITVKTHFTSTLSTTT